MHKTFHIFLIKYQQKLTFNRFGKPLKISLHDHLTF